MVGIVLVSHSPRIAEGTLDLVKQMVGDKVPIEIAAGTADGRLGTDAAAIERKIRKVHEGDGVLVMVDLGSAVLSAEFAIENLGEPLKSATVIADAPFVEGTVAAAIEASFGKSLAEVRAAAEGVKAYSKLG
ncbi:PTS-dependent dihydroxyacetone kinase, phosphotransferase subunit DhaM [Fervidicola ferrireducens]|uniref:phosphoenolpyruvate--glycerone phosphotransferase n=1 Tax=Fervidicola ferrireducens TaxID=520764 RepID=A0A140L8T8_9FIRM|nr:dihydroxyacetone kinase phosphoryl donor subunit DhaM [Fervidicola ferrireducens]KXG76963.1 PTS-dependent dihydroxyacetone kinase, phosphotransferase subunit DhaM [Fervidicola ferrireducens]